MIRIWKKGRVGICSDLFTFTWSLTKDDVTRITALSQNAYATASLVSRRKKRDSAVERTIREVVKSIRTVPQSTGQVRFRHNKAGRLIASDARLLRRVPVGLRFLSPSAVLIVLSPASCAHLRVILSRTQASRGKTHTKIFPLRERFSVPFLLVVAWRRNILRAIRPLLPT